MEHCDGNEPASDTKHLSAGCEQTAMGDQDSQTEVKPPSDISDAVPLEHQPSGKLRRTALRFFGGRKSICVLPNFFGGRNKNLNKWSSKKGVSKSKTHDGLSKADWEDSLGIGYVPAGYFEYHSQKDTAGKACREFGHPTGDQKSFSLPRQKKGLRELFNSIRRRRKNRNCDFEKNEMVTNSHVCNKEVPIAQTIIDQNDMECLGSLSESNVPVLANIDDCLTIAPECINVDVIVSEKDLVKQGSLDSLIGDLKKGEDMVETLHINTEPDSFPKTNLEHTENVQLPTGSSQMSLMFGDVASLKSFDSLTGCGDIIADQDDDSIADSQGTVSAERSRNAGKRSSCYVTYQGGGEEMATPVKVDRDYLHDLWENEVAEGSCYTHSHLEDFLEHSESPRMTPEEPSSSYTMDISSNSNGALGVTETTLTSLDVMTPQSENQVSVPNSDEGYYDSTTPGQDEDGRDKVDRIRTDRLPRDSYSGDALYELFEPDDSLISPPFEKAKLPVSDPLEFLDMSAQCGGEDVNAVFAPETGLIEEDRLTGNREKMLGNPKLSDAVVGTFTSTCQSQEIDSEQNKPQSPRLRGNHDLSKTKNDLEDDQTVCFSQALVDFTKQSHVYSNSTESMGGSESNSPFAQNMQALPAIVTFDVVDMDNEGEYDQQKDMVMEEEYITSPYEVFEESYLQKDAFAECDLTMFDLLEQSLSNTWGIASLPRHLSLTQVNRSSPLAPLLSPLALNRRSRSLDTESLELEMTDMYLGSGAALASCPRTERDSKRVSSLHRKNNGYISTSENRDNRQIMFPSWQPETEGTVTHPRADGERTEQTYSLYQTQNRRMISFGQPVSRVPNCKSQQISASKMTDRVSCNYISQITGPLHRPFHLPLQSESCRPHAPYGRSVKASDGGGEALFYTSNISSHP
ncbi:APC membrane recruitment protein 1-like [Oncorhynchus keta]|uniref:APC membrane recruitment protein 1-like n=1 Tax=Oncorhynchus keta TaxID=8018 RepID=UPI0015FAF473|nr:APC membrane recruitment protein 1-like [Oncorhynchus keta]XP_035636527.1 APC membrane recruitment protein 1-like [Oncorhynchus keta]XP_052313159.1 APC membrane recruitment protein 1-like [Oncorhynchus keta]